ncbi:uncharacterized protein LOC133287976 [Gastrolobium bilobum]|uniref:uncharacterized protein LOC133287976 n=1 Tax=Gastrolobium bilobum TaxID=150636 RepID=UPI002AB0CA76|nr:uncharacterized protein LOC133287976 [Gastrolobium bilobum]
MKKKYQGCARAKRLQLQALRSEFETLRMKSGESIADYFSRVMTIVNKMRIHGDRTEEITVIEKILRSLTAKFNFVVCAIEESKDIDDLSLDELQSSLVVHEHKFKQEDTDEQALKASTDTRSNNFQGSGRGRGRGRGRGKGRSTNFRANNDQFQGRGRVGAPDKSKAAK